MAKTTKIKRVLVLMLALLFTMSLLSITTFANPANQPITVTIDGVQIVFTGTQPQIVDDRTLVPARGVFEHLGFEVNWEPETRNVTLVRPGQFVRLVIDQATFTLNGSQTFQLDVPATIINGSTMLPLRAVIEAIGYQLSWDGPTQTVIIVTDDLFNFVSDDEPQATNLTTVSPVTITRNGTTVATGDETGVHILARVLLTQAEIQSLLPHARTAEETRMSAHPNRAMTQQELAAWNEEYDQLGGMNRFELEVLYHANQARIDNGATMFTVCPNLNRASRLHTNLMADGHMGLSHDDPFYGNATARAAVFGVSPRDEGVSHVSENSRGRSGASMNGNSAVTGWMNSPGHRTALLNLPNREVRLIGIGGAGGFATTKFS